MGPEKEIVDLWLNRRGFFTIKDINAGNRVIDLIAIKHDETLKVAHVEIACYMTGLKTTKKKELLKKFEGPAISRVIKSTIKKHVGRDADYEKFLITTANFKIDGINVIQFDKVLFEIISQLDTQHYTNSTVRTLQLVRFLLLSSPAYAARLLGKEKGKMTASGREEFVSSLLQEKSSKIMFGKRQYEPLLVKIIKNSTLNHPDRLALAINEILNEKTATKFLNRLLSQKKIKESTKAKIKDQTLKQFVEV